MEQFKPEGCRIGTKENNSYLESPAGLERAMKHGVMLEGMVTLCDGKLRLHVDLHCATGIIEPEEAVYCRPGEERKDIAILSRVGKPVVFCILSLEERDGVRIAKLSRRVAQAYCMRSYLSLLRPGDVIGARVTHLEPFGAFLDVGCGIPSLLSVDCISVSRISHPSDRLHCGMDLPVAVKSIDRESGRITLTLRELLGTWEENVAGFESGQTVTGIIRSVENYGAFVELAPNLAGLAEIRGTTTEALSARIGHGVAVYIKSIVPERMKIKLVLIDACASRPAPQKLRFFINPQTKQHLNRWVYSPAGCRKVVETVFDSDSADA